ncbi:MAG: hypothetical protein IJA04_07680 [Bacteroidaceae bacterium]|nr:hypothetical protein [Bacteroidaceae bacterium]MBQ3623564.1 hypothetical protein [Bacteroidaceae bacterium]
MKTSFLLPNKCKKLGKAIFVISAILGFYILFIEESYADGFLIFDSWQAVKNNIAIIGSLLGLALVAFSKERVEDELVMWLRADAMIKALWLSCVLVFLCALFLYGGIYFYYLSVAQYIVLLLYIFIFRYNMYKHIKNNEE